MAGRFILGQKKVRANAKTTPQRKMQCLQGLFFDTMISIGIFMEKITKYDKLVRDKVPQVLNAKGIKSITRKVEGDEYFARLVAKLREEVEEFAKDVNEEEIADILEVLNAIIPAKGFSKEKIEEIRKKKLDERGGFNEKIILEQTEE